MRCILLFFLVWFVGCVSVDVGVGVDMGLVLSTRYGV